MISFIQNLNASKYFSPVNEQTSKFGDCLQMRGETTLHLYVDITNAQPCDPVIPLLGAYYIGAQIYAAIDRQTVRQSLQHFWFSGNSKRLEMSYVHQ